MSTTADALQARAPVKPSRQLSWAEIAEHAPTLVATAQDYLRQLAVSSRPATVETASLALRQFAAHLMVAHPTCTTVAKIGRREVESYKVALAARPGRTAKTVATETIRNNLGQCARSLSG